MKTIEENDECNHNITDIFSDIDSYCDWDYLTDEIQALPLVDSDSDLDLNEAMYVDIDMNEVVSEHDSDIEYDTVSIPSVVSL